MKNSTLKKLFIGSVIVPIGMIAQPTLTATGINPVVGDVLTTNTTQYVAPGSSGASQTWNLAMTSSGSATQTGVAPSSTPYASTFSTATVAFGPTSYVYYKTSSSAYQMNGIVSPSGTVISYSNLEDLLRFPVTYNSTYTDTWAATFTQSSYTYYRTGSSAVTADGWGTLTTPAGTFSNVMRVHFVQTYQDSTNISSQPFIITYSNDEYMWYLNGNHNPIAAVYTLNTSAGGPYTGGQYMDNVVSGVEEQNGISSLSLFPTLASDHVNFTYTLGAAGDVMISIFNEAGQLVMEAPQGTAITGENTCAIDVAELATGNYFAEIQTGNGDVATKRFVIAR